MRRLLILTLLASASVACDLEIPEDGDLGGDGDRTSGGDGDGDLPGGGDGDGHTSHVSSLEGSPVEGSEAIQLPGGTVALGQVIAPCDITAGATATCGTGDPLEPNNADAPLTVTFSDGCYVLNSTLTETDRADAVRWTHPRRDPVRVGIAYNAEAASQNDLSLVVRDATGRQAALEQSSRSGLSEEEHALVLADQGGISTMETYVASNTFAGCQPYKLYVDTRWCTDSLEDNDKLTSPTNLDLGTNGLYTISANAAQGDPDFFHFTVPSLRDPVFVELTYTASVQDTLDLGLTILDFNGNELLRDDSARSGAQEALSYWIRPATLGNVYNLKVSGSGAGCVPYTLTVNRNVCSDNYEDNDEPAEKKPIAGDQVIRARVLGSDPDYYDLAGFASAVCSASFEPSENTESIKLVALDAEGHELEEDVSRGMGGTATVSIDLRDVQAATLAVTRGDKEGGACVTYNLRCTTR